MMTHKRIILFLALAMCTLTTHVHARTVEWRRTPIDLELSVGVEQMIILPQNGAVGLPAELSNKNIFRTLVTGGTAYWTALEAFESKRIQVRLDSGEFLLFDVTAKSVKAPPSSAPQLQIVLPGVGLSVTGEDSNTRDVQTGQRKNAVTIFELIRYAAQAVYSPARLVAPLQGVRPVPVNLSGNISALYDQGKHPGLVIQPLKGWAVDGLHITAFVLTNQHSHPMLLDNRKIRHAKSAQRTGVAPHFIASTFFSTELSARGEPGSRTTLFVVTQQPIRSVLRGL